MKKAEWNARIQAKQSIIHIMSGLPIFAPEYQFLARVWQHINAPLFPEVSR